MGLINSVIRFKLLNLIPLIILFYIAFNGNSTISFKFISINIQYILVYYWVLSKPDSLGYGLIFISGLISDVVFGLPLGANALSLLIIAAFAAYARALRVRTTLINDWVSFIPALLIGNFVYFFTLQILDYDISYLYLFQNSIFTFILYPLFWGIFSLILNLTRS